MEGDGQVTDLDLLYTEIEVGLAGLLVPEGDGELVNLPR